MESLLGNGVSILSYLLVLIVYWCMFLVIRYPRPALELNYRGTFYFLAIVWAVAMFSGNYLFYRLGVMAYLPWFNNFIHSFIWIGICLTWLYYTTRERPIVERFILFAFTSFIIKATEYKLLGSWAKESYLGINNRYAYIIIMSLVDGFYPIISVLLIKALSKKGTFGVYEV